MPLTPSPRSLANCNHCHTSNICSQSNVHVVRVFKHIKLHIPSFLLFRAFPDSWGKWRTDDTRRVQSSDNVKHVIVIHYYVKFPTHISTQCTSDYRRVDSPQWNRSCIAHLTLGRGGNIEWIKFRCDYLLTLSFTFYWVQYKYYYCTVLKNLSDL